MDNKLLNIKSFKTIYSALLVKFKSLIVKPDWNQNDKSANNYIKNRTHYTEIVDGKEIVHKLNDKYLPDSVQDKIQDAAKKKMDTENPTGVGSFSMNRNPYSYIGEYSHAEGNWATASEWYSHAEGWATISSGIASHAEGENTTASNTGSHAEGYHTTASGESSHAEGYGLVQGLYLTGNANSTSYTVSGNNKIKIGKILKYNNIYAKIINYNSFTGTITTDKTLDSVNALNYTPAELIAGIAFGDFSHTEGHYTTASGTASHAEGYYTTASSANQHVQGIYNIEDSDDVYAHIVGNGDDEDNRSNAHTLDWSGNAWFLGEVYIGSTSGLNKDEGSKKLATEEYINIRVPAWTEEDEGKVLKIVNGIPTWSL